MREQNKKISFVMAIFVIFAAMFVLTACGGGDAPEYAWGKTFRYQGVMTDSKRHSGGIGEQKGSEQAVLIKNEYNNNNLDFANASVNGVKVDFTSLKGTNAEDFINKLDSFAANRMTEKYRDFTVVVGTEEEKTITINNVKYALEKSESGMDGAYNVVDKSDPSVPKFIAFCNVLISTNVEGKTKGCLSLAGGNEFFSDYNFDVKIVIPTIRISTDPSANRQVEIVSGQEVVKSTSVSLIYTPYLSKAEA